MNLTRDQLISIVYNWVSCWNNKNIDAILELFHHEISFENWTTIRFTGKESIKKMLQTWFTNDQEFSFRIENIFADEVEQKVCYEWLLNWPSIEKKYKGKIEKRRGVDVIHFQDGRIIKKNVYSKTSIHIDNKIKPLVIY